MTKFRYAEQEKQNELCSRVQIAACLALHNLAAKPRGQKMIGPDGVRAVLDALVAHVDDVMSCLYFDFILFFFYCFFCVFFWILFVICFEKNERIKHKTKIIIIKK